MSQATEHAIVSLARRSIMHYLTYGEMLTPPVELPPEWRKPAGVFVSLKQHGALRGCIGTCLPTQLNVAWEVIHNAVHAATMDPRFPPLTVDDLDHAELSVDILMYPDKVEDAEELDPKRFGIIVRSGARVGVLLPDIPTVVTVTQQLAVARRKAGIRPDDPVEMYRFEVVRYQ